METVTYYALIDTGWSRENPSGLVRRRVVDGRRTDEAFTRRLRWEPTEYLRLYHLGHNDVDHEEISPEEADAFVERMTQKLGDGS